MKLGVAMIPLLAVGLGGCVTDAGEQTETGKQASIADVQSITRRTDGLFTVHCRDGRVEDGVTGDALRADRVCMLVPPPPPTQGRIVNGRDITFLLADGSRQAEVTAWGRGLWDGYVSFTVAVSGEPSLDRLTLVDATGASYDVPTSATRYDRLPLPVRMLATTDTSQRSTAVITNVRYEVTATHPIPAQAIRGRFEGTSTQELSILGGDIPGVTMTMNVQGRFFQNFTNGSGCGRLTINGVSVTASDAQQNLRVTAPARIVAHPTCVSSRLASPENATADFELAVSSIQLGDPI